MVAHIYLGHADCAEGHCLFCIGTPGFCIVCKGSEGEIPTECPGRPMTRDQADAVRTGELDYRDGRWTALRR